MTAHEHEQGTTLRVLAIYLVTREPSEPLVTKDGQRIETETILCKCRCLECGVVTLERLPFTVTAG